MFSVTGGSAYIPHQLLSFSALGYSLLAAWKLNLEFIPMKINDLISSVSVVWQTETRFQPE